jgi:TM2 domain-containing membrane protein YozV
MALTTFIHSKERKATMNQPNQAMRPQPQGQMVQTDKDKTTAALLAFFLGGIGVHRFYLGDTGKGVVMLLFFWTAIPAIIALIDFIKYLTMSDQEFAQYANRVG